MTLGAILLGLALLTVVVLVVARPLIQASRPTKKTVSPYEQLVQRKNGLLNEIDALDFDHDTRKIPTEVYEPQRAYLVAEAAEVLQELDGMKTAGTSDDVLAQIELAVGRMRRPTGAAPAAAPATNGKERGNYCPQCGQLVEAGDNFCAACGYDVRAGQPAY